MKDHEFLSLSSICYLIFPVDTDISGVTFRIRLTGRGGRPYEKTDGDVITQTEICCIVGYIFDWHLFLPMVLRGAPRSLSSSLFLLVCWGGRMIGYFKPYSVYKLILCLRV